MGQRDSFLQFCNENQYFNIFLLSGTHFFNTLHWRSNEKHIKIICQNKIKQLNGSVLYMDFF